MKETDGLFSVTAGDYIFHVVGVFEECEDRIEDDDVGRGILLVIRCLLSDSLSVEAVPLNEWNSVELSDLISRSRDMYAKEYGIYCRNPNNDSEHFTLVKVHFGLVSRDEVI